MSSLARQDANERELFERAQAKLDEAFALLRTLESQLRATEEQGQRADKEGAADSPMMRASRPSEVRRADEREQLLAYVESVHAEALRLKASKSRLLGRPQHQELMRRITERVEQAAAQLENHDAGAMSWNDPERGNTLESAGVAENSREKSFEEEERRARARALTTIAPPRRSAGEVWHSSEGALASTTSGESHVYPRAPKPGDIVALVVPPPVAAGPSEEPTAALVRHLDGAGPLQDPTAALVRHLDGAGPLQDPTAALVRHLNGAGPLWGTAAAPVRHFDGAGSPQELSDAVVPTLITANPMIELEKSGARLRRDRSPTEMMERTATRRTGLFVHFTRRHMLLISVVVASLAMIAGVAFFVTRMAHTPLPVVAEVLTKPAKAAPAPAELARPPGDDTAPNTAPNQTRTIRTPPTHALPVPASRATPKCAKAKCRGSTTGHTSTRLKGA